MPAPRPNGHKNRWFFRSLASRLRQLFSDPRTKRRNGRRVLLRRRIYEIVAVALHLECGPERLEERAAREFVRDQRETEQRDAVSGDGGLNRLTLVRKDEFGFGRPAPGPLSASDPMLRPRGAACATRNESSCASPDRAAHAGEGAGCRRERRRPRTTFRPRSLRTRRGHSGSPHPQFRSAGRRARRSRADAGPCPDCLDGTRAPAAQATAR